jgi:hypothetical protein
LSLALGRDDNDMTTATQQVWVFNGEGARFPAGVFSSRERAEAWIRARKLSGILTAYPLDEGCFDWALREGLVTGRARERGNDAAFVDAFSCAAQDHAHFCDGSPT